MKDKLLKKGQLPILIFTIAYMMLFGFLLLQRGVNILVPYLLLIIFFLVIMLFLNKKSIFPNWILWGLSLWGAAHMAGGSVNINGVWLYDKMLVPLSSALPILRYDQVVHAIGFGIGTYAIYYLAKPELKEKNWILVSLILFFGGLGIGALNEIIEMTGALLATNTIVGDELNTYLDFIADIIGIIATIIIINIKEKR